MGALVFRLSESIRCPEAEHALAAAASLLEFPWRIETGGLARPEDLQAWVGPRSSAPAGTALVVPCEGWPRWNPADLHASDWAGLPMLGTASSDPAPDAETIPSEWLRAIGFLVLREEERLDPRRDQWGCYAAPYSRMTELGLLKQPLVNRWVARLETIARGAAGRLGIPLEARPRWPRGAQFAVALSHDVDWTRRYSWRDGWRSIRRSPDPRGYAFRHGVVTLLGALRHGDRGDPYWTFDRWAEAESRRGFRSTFFVCPPDPGRDHEYDPTYRFEDPVEFRGARTTLGSMFRILADEGFEIGVHASYRSYRDAEMLARQRAGVAQLIGREVTGIRQHFLRLDPEVTLAAQAAAGYTHDATLGYNEQLGFRAGIAAPFHPWDAAARRAIDLIELPTTVMDGALFRTMALDQAGAARATVAHLEAVEAAGGLAVLLWHPNSADPGAFPGWWNAYEAALEHLSGRPAWVTALGDVARWWRSRSGEPGVVTT